MAGMAPGFGREMIGYSVSKHGVVALTRTMANDPRWVPKTPHVIVKITFGRRELAIFHCSPQSSYQALLLTNTQLAGTKSNINAYAQLGLTQRLSQALTMTQLEARMPALRRWVA